MRSPPLPIYFQFIHRLGKGLGICRCVRVCGLRKIVSLSRMTCSVEGRFFTLLRGELSEVILAYPIVFQHCVGIRSECSHCEPARNFWMRA